MTIRDIAVAFGFEVDKSSEAQAKSSVEGLKNFATKLLGSIAVVFSVQKLSAFASDCVQAASNVEEMQNKFDVVFQGINEDVEEWAANFADSVGRNKNTIKTYLADQQNLLVGFGMTREEGAKLSEEMTTLALDLASFANLDETIAVNNMTKAVMGESEAAKALGAVLNDVTRAETMAAMGIEGKYDKLSQLEKMQVNYNAILRQSPDAIGDCIRSMDSYEAAQRRQKAATDELKETIGGQLIPIYTTLTNAKTKAIKVATSFAKALLGDSEESNHLLHAFERVHALVKKLQPSFERLSQSFQRGINGASGGMKLIVPLVEKIAGFAVDNIAHAIDGIVALADKLGGIQNLFRILATVAAAFFVVNNWGAIIDGAKKAFGVLQGILKLLGGFNLGTMALVAAVALLFLAVDDFVNFMMGNDSVLGVMFERAGIDAEEMRQKIINIWENLKSFFAGVWNSMLKILEPILEKVKTYFQGVFGEDLFSGLGSGIAGAIEFLERLTDAIAQNEGLQETIAKIAVGIVGLVAALKILGPILNTVVNVFKVLKGAATAAWTVITKIGTFLSSTFGGVTMVIGGAVLAVTNFVSMFQNGFSVVKEILMVIGVALAAVGAVILGAPVAVAAAVAGVIAAVATLVVVVKEHWTEIVEWTRNAWTSVKEFLSGLWESLKEKVSGVFNKIGSAIGNAVSAVKERIVSAWTSVYEKVSGVLNAIGNFIGSVWEKVSGTVSSILTGIRERITSIWNGIYTTIEPLLTAFKYLFETIFQAILILAGRAFDAVRNKISEIWNGIVSFLSPILEGIRSKVEAAWNAVREAVSSAVETVRSVVSEKWEAARTAVSGALEAIRSTVSSVWSSVTETVSGAMETVKGWIISGWETVYGAVSEKLNAIRDFVSSVWEAIKTVVSSVMETVSNTVSSIWDRIRSGVSEKVDGIRQTIEDGFNAAKNFVTNLVSEAAQWGSDLIGNIVSGIRSGIDGVAGAVTGVADKIRSFLHFSVPDEGPLTDMESWMPDMMRQLAEGIENGDGAVASALRNLSGGLANLVQDGLSMVGGMFRAGWQTITSGLGSAGAGMSGISGAISGIGNAIASAWTTAQNVTASAWGNIENFLTSTWNGILQTAGAVWQSVSSAVTSALERMQSSSISVVSGLGTILGGAWERISGVVTGAAGAVLSASETAWTSIQSVVTAVQGGISATVSAAWTGVRENVTATANAVQTVITNVFGAVLSFLSGNSAEALAKIQTAWNAILTSVVSIAGNIQTVVTTAFTAIQSVVGQVLSTVQGLVSSGMGAVSGTFSSILSGIQANVGSTFSNMVSSVTGAMGNVRSAIVSGMESAVNYVKSLPSQAMTWGADIVNGIASGVRNAIGNVTGAVTDVAGKIRSYLHFSVPDEGPLTDYESWMPDFMTGLVESLDKSSPALMEAVDRIAEMVKERLVTAFADAGASFAEKVSSAWDTVAAVGSGIQKRLEPLAERIGSALTLKQSDVPTAPIENQFAEALERAGYSLPDMQDRIKALGVTTERFCDILAASEGDADAFADALFHSCKAGASFQDVEQAIGIDLEKLGEIMGGAGAFSKEGFAAALESAGDSLSGLQKRIEALGVSAETFYGILSSADGNADTFADAIYDAAQKAVSFQDVERALGVSTEELGAIMSTLSFPSTDGLASALESAGHPLDEMRKRLEALGITGEAFHRALGQNREDAEAFADALFASGKAGTSFEDIEKAIGLPLDDLSRLMREAASGAGSGTQDVLVSALGGLASALGGIGYQAGVDFIGRFRDGILAGIGAIAGLLQSALGEAELRLNPGPGRDPNDRKGFDDGDGGEWGISDGLLEKILSVLMDVSALRDTATARPSTAVTSMVSNRTTSSVTQNVNIDNTYNGASSEGAKAVTRAMKKSASDATDYMARALQYA